VITPNTNYLLQGTENTWAATLYKNNVAQPDTFVFSLDSRSVPNVNYVYEVVSSQEFKVHNYEMFLTDYLEVTATSGVYARVIQINLLGAW
jgi:hypothetical protein